MRSEWPRAELHLAAEKRDTRRIWTISRGEHSRPAQETHECSRDSSRADRALAESTGPQSAQKYPRSFFQRADLPAPVASGLRRAIIHLGGDSSIRLVVMRLTNCSCARAINQFALVRSTRRGAAVSSFSPPPPSSLALLLLLLAVDVESIRRLAQTLLRTNKFNELAQRCPKSELLSMNINFCS